MDGFLLTRVLLRFPTEDPDVLEDVSAAHLDTAGRLWVASDEGRVVWRLQPDPDRPHVFGDAEPVGLDALLRLPGADDEIDIESLDGCDGFLWLVGSHSGVRKKAKGKDPDQDWVRLSTVERRPARRILARVPLDGDDGAAVLRSDEALMDALADDPHLGPFVRAGIPSKDNGLDIEGLAVEPLEDATRVWLGLRGPVLRGYAVLLELEVTVEGNRLVPRSFDGRPYRSRFLDLDGRGIRELQRVGDDLLVLAGPPMKLAASSELFRLKNAASADAVVPQGDALVHLFDLPRTPRKDDAEGLTLFPCFDGETGLLVAFDTSWPERRRGNGLLVDVFRVPGL